MRCPTTRGTLVNAHRDIRHGQSALLGPGGRVARGGIRTRSGTELDLRSTHAGPVHACWTKRSGHGTSTRTDHDDAGDVLKPDASLQQAAELMLRRTSAAAGLRRHDHLGTVTDRDITVRGTAKGSDPARTRGTELMSAGERRYCFSDDDVKMWRNHADRQIRAYPSCTREKTSWASCPWPYCPPQRRPDIGDTLEGLSAS